MYIITQFNDFLKTVCPAHLRLEERVHHELKVLEALEHFQSLSAQAGETGPRRHCARPQATQPALGGTLPPWRPGWDRGWKEQGAYGRDQGELGAPSLALLQASGVGPPSNTQLPEPCQDPSSMEPMSTGLLPATIYRV